MKSLVWKILLSSTMTLYLSCIGNGASDSDTDTDTETDSSSEDDSDTGPLPGDLLTLEFEITDHLGPVYSLDWSSDDAAIVSAGWGQVGVFDASSGTEMATLSGHKSFVWGVSVSPDASTVASASQDGSVRLWQMGSYEELDALETAWTFCVDWNGDGTRFVTGNDFDQVQIWDAQSLSVINTYSVGDSLYDGFIISVDWSPDGQTIAAGYWSGKIACIDAETADEIYVLDNYTASRCDTNGVAWSPDSNVLASAHQDGNVRLWDRKTGELMNTLVGHNDWVRGVAWSPNAQYLVSTGADRSVRVWDPESGELLSTHIEHPAPAWSVVWSPDGTRLATGGGGYNSTATAGNTIIVWSIN